MQDIGDYKISMIGKEVALHYVALVWLENSLMDARNQAIELGDDDLTDVFEAYGPALKMIKQAVLMQAIEQSHALGTAESLKAEIMEQSETFEKLQKIVLLTSIEAIQRRNAA